MTAADRRDRAVALLCNLLSLYLLLGLLAGASAVITWLIFTFGGLE